METQDFSIARGTAPRLRFRLTTAEDVSTWTVLLQVRADTRDDSNTVFSKAGAIATVPQASTLGIFDVALSATDTLTFVQNRRYYYEFRRTNAGFEDILTRGVMSVI